MNAGQLLALNDLQSVEQSKGIQVTRVSWPDGIVGEGKNQMIGP